MKYLYPCPECWGTGQTECSECGTEHECERCKGTHHDPRFVNIDAYLAAEKSMLAKGATWGLVENRVLVGRGNGKDVVRVEDYKR